MMSESETENRVTIIGSPSTSALPSDTVDNHTYGYTITPKGTPSQLLNCLGYTSYYNHDTKCPNWVAWHLTKKRTDGPYSRKGVPYYDEDGTAIAIGPVTPKTQRGDYFLDIESEDSRQLLSDWQNNEYAMTHGHIRPAGDNKWSKPAMNQLFLLTNHCSNHPRWSDCNG